MRTKRERRQVGRKEGRMEEGREREGIKEGKSKDTCTCTCTWEERKERWAKIGQKKKETHKRWMQVHVDIHVHVDVHVKEVMEED